MIVIMISSFSQKEYTVSEPRGLKAYAHDCPAGANGLIRVLPETAWPSVFEKETKLREGFIWRPVCFICMGTGGFLFLEVPA
jgi:hypothetical protein